MQIIPAIDLIDGKAVRLRQGRYEDVTTYTEPPDEIARGWRGKVPHLHVVDLEGAKAGHAVQTDAVRKLVAAFGEGVQTGGGIRSFAAVESYFALGVSRVVLGTAAIRDPELLKRAAEAYPHRIIVAVDAKDGFVATDGWLEVSERRAVDLVRDVGALPIAGVLYTDIQRDGMETGPNVVETARLADETGVPVIASGGVGTVEHLRALSKASPRIVAAIVGRALHEHRFTLDEAVQAARS
ncbi:MAG TPA: 1-(5-phosphoribosyl)-5-[(5-phosphoribosylamino)methylideneamino]imidazole-4-carboxamide isomerase [Polyangiaceae bacterium]|jgi:phosphoribosylformimino-5-aminoimidazole carboxamide ribotide isomerase|nr:1-(5-phosphoribosyl)-5-[(5-phosphoribosylamino)methylideneamino]imidazole-4-carboxamide isomerase [Polyangiaceae bacterium]